MNKKQAQEQILNLLKNNPDKHLDKEIYSYVEFLVENQPYIEANQKGQQYLAIRTFNHLGYGRSKGVGIYLSAYINLVPEDGRSIEWIQILENLSTLDNKLIVLGNHGQTLVIDINWLINECINSHLR